MLFSSSIWTCQFPPLEASASGVAMIFAFNWLRAEVMSSPDCGGVTLLLSRSFLLYQSALPWWTLNGTDQSSPFALTMSLIYMVILLSSSSVLPQLFIGYILYA